MSYMVAASTGFREARDIYTAGFKSANKLHLDPNSFWAAGDILEDEPLSFGEEKGEVDPDYEFKRGLANIDISRIRIENGIDEKNFLKYGKKLLKMRPLSANCSELAMMAAASAWVKLGEPKVPPVALVSLAKPADHVFCVVGDDDHIFELLNWTIEGLVMARYTDVMWVADPWLNVNCRLQDYPARAAAKFNKWQAANKRIAWKTGPQGAGWYPPVGEYAKKFAAAEMELIMG